MRKTFMAMALISVAGACVPAPGPEQHASPAAVIEPRTIAELRSDLEAGKLGCVAEVVGNWK